MSKYPGSLIVFEGIDGCGKTSTIEEVYRQLSEEGHKVVMLANIVEGSTTGGAIRAMLSNKGDTIDDIRIINLYLSELRYAIHNKMNGITKYLEEGYIVLCSRWFYSTYAYIKQTEATSNIIYNSTYDLPEPDLSIYLKVSVDIAVERIRNRNTTNTFDYFEKRDKLDIIKNRYNTLFSNNVLFPYSKEKIVNNGLVVNNEKDFEYNTLMIKELIVTIEQFKQKKNLINSGDNNE